MDLNKEDIEKLIFHKSKNPIGFWGEFDYTELEMKDGQSFFVSHLIINDWVLMDEILYTQVETVKEWFQMIKNS